MIDYPRCSKESDDERCLVKEQSIVDKESGAISSVLAVDEFTLASAGDDAAVKIWNIRDNKKELIQTLIGHSNAVRSLCLLEEG